MIKFYNSLMFRLTIAFIFLITIVTGATYAYTYNVAKKALKSTIQDQLIQLSGIAADTLTSEQISYLSRIQPGDEDDTAYRQILEQFYNVRKNDKDVSEFYVMRKEGEKISFIADDWFVDPEHANADDPDDQASNIGDEYEDYDPILLEAFNNKRTASEDFYTDQWGTWLSGYAPLSENGEVVAVLAVDMDVSTVQAKINFISQLIYYIIALAIIAAGLIILFFSKTIVKDLNSITKVAEKLSKGDLDVEMPQIKSKNEIYLLNEGMKSMMAAIAFLTDQVKR